MKSGMTAAQAFGLFGIVVVFGLTLFVAGLVVGQHHGNKVPGLPEISARIEEEPVGDVRPSLGFYEELEATGPTPRPPLTQAAPPEEKTAKPIEPAPVTVKSSP